jgi:3-deoxy-manno-octulosonate cytidylyltransferase (CMP-KDO synthetase)
VVVATDDQRIADAVAAFEGEVIVTAVPYRTGTDRVAGIARDLPGDVFVNLQGDEIPLHPGLLGDLITPFLKSAAPMGTLKRLLSDEGDLRNPAVVKVVTTVDGRALYFSRASIPLVRDASPGRGGAAGLHYVHLGLYIYTRGALARLAALPTSPLEDAEKLEQLRALEHGMTIRVWETAYPSLRLDTPADVELVEAVLQGPVPC